MLQHWARQTDCCATIDWGVSVFEFSGPSPTAADGFAGNGPVGDVAMTETMNFSAVNADAVLLYCAKGASSYDGTVTNTGDQTTAGNLTTTTTTPAASAGLIISTSSQSLNTANGLTSGLFQSCLYSAEALSSAGCDQNNGNGISYKTSTSNFSFTWTEVGGTTAVGDWAAIADAFH